MEIKPSRKLSNYLIDWNHQLLIISYCLTYMVIAVIVTVSICLAPLVYDMIAVKDLDAQYTAAQNLLFILNRLLPGIVGLFLLFALHMIVVTHRVFGPLINFTKTFKALARGDFTRRVNVRDKDYLKREGTQINEMMDGLSGKIRDISVRQQDLAGALERLASCLDDPAQREKTGPIIDELRKEAEDIAFVLSGFKL
ncbi:MAG: methyl-accepting chemotaxis protein [Smithellaceae bacterium]|nr:methyl-accepting chemotaxis protein [Smithellaceae bacterium]